MNRLKCNSTSQIHFCLHFTVCMKSFLWWSQVSLFRIPASCRLQLTWLHRSLVGRLGNRPLIRSTPCLQHSGLLLLVEPSQVCTLIYDATWTLLKLLLLLLLRHFYLNVVFFLPIPLSLLFFFFVFFFFVFFFFFFFFFFFYVCLVYSIIPSYFFFFYFFNSFNISK